MSRALRVFTDYFIKGLGIGTGWQDKAEDREIKRQQAAAQLAHWREQAAWRRDQLGETQRLNTAKIAQAGAYTEYLRRKGMGGGAGAGAPVGNVGTLYNEFGVQPPAPPAPPSSGGGSSEAPPPPDLGSSPTPSFDGGTTNTETDARGGRVGKARPAFAGGGAIATTANAFMSGFNRSQNRNRGYGNYDWQTGQPLPQPTTPPIMPGNMPMGEAQSYGSAGTTGPGSGYGDNAAPPVITSTSGYDAGGRVTDTAGYKAEVGAKDQAQRDEIRSRYEDYYRGRQGAREWAERREGAPDWSRYNAASSPSSGGYQRGGRVQSFQGGGTPTPVVRGNLRQTDDGTYVDDQGRLIDRPVQDYERVDPRYDATRISVPPPGQWQTNPPRPPDPNAPDVRDPAEQERARRALARREGDPQFASTEQAAAAPQKTDRDTAIDLESPTERMKALAWKGRQSPMPGPYPPRPDAPRSVTNPPNPDDYDAPSRGSYERRRPAPPRGGSSGPAGTEPDAPPQGTPQLDVGAGLAGPGVGGGEKEPSKPGMNPNEARMRQPEPDWARARRQAPSRVDEGQGWPAAQTPTGAGTVIIDQDAYPPRDTEYKGPSEPEYTNKPAGAPPKKETQYGPGTEGPSPAPRRAGPAGPPRQVDPRDKAFDPSKAPLDPRSGLIIDSNGRIVGRLGPDGLPVRESPRTGTEAISTAPPVTEPAGGYGYNPQGSNVYGAGLSSNNAARDYNYAIQGASNHAKTTYGDTPQAKMALAAGHGAGSPADVDAVMRIVDPDGKLAPHERMIAATKAVHDFHMANGDQKSADAASFAITQWGNGMAKQHGAEAMKALQKGDTNGAMNQLMAGYGWIPDSGTPHYDQRSNSIVVTGPDGKVSATIPVQPGTLQNLSLGMMSGQLAWDVIHSHNGTAMGGDHPQAAPAQAPPVTRPAAQPSAAPAGPPAPPPAATPQSSPPGSAAPQPSPQATTPPMSPQTAATQQPPAPPPAPTPPAPTPPAPTPAPPERPPPGTVRFAPSDADTSGVTFDKPQAIQMTAPTTPPAPQAKPAPTGGTAAPASTSAPAKTGQEQRTVEQGGGEQKTPTTTEQTPEQKAKAASDEAQQKHWDKDPYAPLPQRHSETAVPPPNIKAYDDRIAELQKNNEAMAQAIVKRSVELGLINNKTKALPSSVTTLIKEKNKENDDMIKQLQAERKERIARFEAEEKSDREETKPIRITPTDNMNLKSGYKTQRETMAKEAKDNPKSDTAARVNASPLRYAGPNDLSTIDTIATQIYAQNSHKLTPDQAYELALQSTSIMPPSKEIPDPVGLNRQKGGKATKFAPIAYGQRVSAVGSEEQPNILLRFGDGTQILVDKPTYNRITQIHNRNWQNYEQNKDKESSWLPSWKTVGAAIRPVAPMLPIVGPVIESVTRPGD